MQTFIEVVIEWIVLSCTVGPVLTWAFFYSKREARATRNSTRSNDRSRVHVRPGVREAQVNPAHQVRTAGTR
jgi:hypothetical protein